MGEVLLVEDDLVVGSGWSWGEVCKVCKGKYRILRCLVFLIKSLNWWCWFVRLNVLCYCCLFIFYVRKRCLEKNGCMEKDCVYFLSYYLLLYVFGVILCEVKEIERNVD